MVLTLCLQMEKNYRADGLSNDQINGHLVLSEIACQFILQCKMNPYKAIYEQIFDEAAFLWESRSAAVEQPDNNAETLHELELSIDTHLDGLMASIEDTWETSLEALNSSEPGAVFTAAVLAFRSHDVKKIQVVIEAGLANEEAEKGLISAMGWLPGRLVHGWIEKFLSSKELGHKFLAIASCSVRRENPGEALTRILDRGDCKQHEKLYCRALRLIGELRRQDLMPYLNEAMGADHIDICFWSNWSAILLGNRSAVENLKPYVFKNGNHQQKAIGIAFRVLPIDQARQWIAELGKDNEQARSVIKATGVLGDPHAVNWLISKMQQPAASRLAAESFTAITGIDLESNTLALQDPPPIEQAADDADDDDISHDKDENLPWPDVAKVKQIWMNHGRNFIAGQRYFMGRTISPELLNEKLLNGNQRQRHAAAMELALIDSGLPLLNTRARVIDKLSI